LTKVTTPVSLLVRITEGAERFKFVPVIVTDPVVRALVEMLVILGPKFSVRYVN
jgi:hypothetical protein